MPIQLYLERQVGTVLGYMVWRALLQKDTSQALTCTWALGDHGLSSLQPAPLPGSQGMPEPHLL